MKSKRAKNAPKRLIDAYEKREIRNGRALLGTLLFNNWVDSPWTELTRHVRSDQQWLRVWVAIASAKGRSSKTRLRVSPSDQRDKFKSIAETAAKLADAIKDGPLDVLAHELWGADDWAALGEPDLKRRGREMRSDRAHHILRHWPSVRDLLQQLQTMATSQAKQTMGDPRPDMRANGDVSLRIFVWCLGKDFKMMFGQKLIGTVALIAEIAFDKRKANQEVTRSFVQSVLKGV